MKVSKTVTNIINNIKPRDCKNNTQRVLLSLLKTSTKDGWVSRTAIRVPSVTARIRDLRKDEFGGFTVECETARALNRRTRQTVRPTYYRVDPKSVTVNSVKTAFKGVI